MKEIFFEVTDSYPEEEEETFLCRAEARPFNLWDDGKTEDKPLLDLKREKVQITENTHSMYKPACSRQRDMQPSDEEHTTWSQGIISRCDEDDEARNEERKLWRDQTTNREQICRVDMQANYQVQNACQVLFKKNAEDNEKK